MPHISKFARFAAATSLVTGCSSAVDYSPPPEGSPGAGGSTYTYTPPTCGQTCQDYMVGLALADTVWLLYNQNVAGTPAGIVDKTGLCPLGGSVHITGTTTVASDGTTTLHLVFDLMNCANSGSLYSLTFNGVVAQDGTTRGGTDKFTAITFRSDALTISGALKFLDDPGIDETCDVSTTDRRSVDSESLNGRVCGREFSSETALDNLSGSGGSGSGGQGNPSAGTGATGGTVTGGPGCPSIYDGKYMGQFAFDYETAGAMPMSGTASFNLTVTLQCIAVANGSATLAITQANASHPYFGCQVGGCAPGQGSVAVLPANPPTTPSSPSQAGHGLVVLFPNGASLGTQNQQGDLNATSDGRILSNSVSSGTTTWTAASLSAPSAFPGDGSSVTSFKSWSLTKSAL